MQFRQVYVRYSSSFSGRSDTSMKVASKFRRTKQLLRYKCYGITITTIAIIFGVSTTYYIMRRQEPHSDFIDTQGKCNTRYLLVLIFRSGSHFISQSNCGNDVT